MVQSRRPTRRLGFGACARVAALVARPAEAATAVFELNGPIDANWTLDRSPTPFSAIGNSFVVAFQPAVIEGEDETLIFLSFFNATGGGGFRAVTSAGDFAASGAQLFSGTLAAPTFLNGSFALSDGYSLALRDPAGAAVPEPAAGALMIAGFGGAGSALRRRRSLAAA